MFFGLWRVVFKLYSRCHHVVNTFVHTHGFESKKRGTEGRRRGDRRQEWEWIKWEFVFDVGSRRIQSKYRALSTTVRIPSRGSWPGIRPCHPASFKLTDFRKTPLATNAHTSSQYFKSSTGHGTLWSIRLNGSKHLALLSTSQRLPPELSGFLSYLCFY